jgi:hypothetical protein
VPAGRAGAAADPDVADPRIETFMVENLDQCLFVSETADCAIFVEPQLRGFAAPFEIWTMAPEWYLADTNDDVWRWLDIGDLATFIGFAGTGKGPRSKWWDQTRSIPMWESAHQPREERWQQRLW